VATNIFNPNGVASGARRGFNPFRVDDFRRTVWNKNAEEALKKEFGAR
jgi:hypothetical protein